MIHLIIMIEVRLFECTLSGIFTLKYFEYVAFSSDLVSICQENMSCFRKQLAFQLWTNTRFMYWFCNEYHGMNIIVIFGLMNLENILCIYVFGIHVSNLWTSSNLCFYGMHVPIYVHRFNINWGYNFWKKTTSYMHSFYLHPFQFHANFSYK